MTKKLLILFLLLSLSLVGATLAQDITLDATYTSENGVLTFSHPDGWGVDDQGENIFLFPDAEDHRFSFMLLNDVIQESLGLSNDMSAEEAMIIFVGAIPGGVVGEDDIVLANYGDNSVATIELDNGGEYVIASIVETSGGLVMIQALGNEDAVDAARDVYFDMIETAIITLQDDDVDENTSDTDEATQTTQALFISDDDALTFAIPDGWSVDVEDGDIAYYLESESDDFEDVALDIYIVTPQIEDAFGFGIDDSIGRATVTSYAAIEENGFTVDDIVKATIGDYPVVFFTLGGILDKNSTFMSAIVETDNGLILVQLEVSNKQLNDAYEIYIDLIASIDYMP